MPDLSLLPDRPAPPQELRLRDLRHGLWLHPDVSDELRDWTHLYKRLGIVLQHLAAHGRTTVVKGCRDKNRGWRRSPLGGANGMQFYLWWSPQGSQVAKDLDLPSSAIVVRAVRHHDDHTPLAPGALDDYLPFPTPEDLTDGDTFAGQPWTDAQMDFVGSEHPVRLLLGRPGSGKTTVLWKAVEARASERVLYLTWSRSLTRIAEDRLSSFAPADVEVVARDFSTFLGEVCGADVPRLSLAASQAALQQGILRNLRDSVRPWRNRNAALHAEMRAVLYGQAVPGEAGCLVEQGIARLTDEEYRNRRGYFPGVGARAATALIKVARALPSRDVEAAFPELIAAGRAIKRLRDDRLPDGFDRFDRIVVDEIQDLTLVETAVVAEVCQAIGRKRGRLPWLLVAGDAGQTVRPTDFDWGPLGDLLSAGIGTPAKFHLDEHLRCPARIAEVVDRVSERYAHIEKAIRPTKQRRQHGGQHVDAHLIYVGLSTRDEASALLEQLADADEVVMLSPRSDPLPWVPEHLRDSVLTPEQAKGLEYQSVCVLGPGSLLSSLPEPDDDRFDDELDQLEYRIRIDHLRVAASRATETLVFVDMAPSYNERFHSMQLLGDAAPYTAEDLVDHFANADASPEERVLVRTNDARMLADSAPARAWQRAYQAFQLLGEPDLPNGVSDPVLRRETRTLLLSMVVPILVDLDWQGDADHLAEAHSAAMVAARGPDGSSSKDLDALEALWDWRLYREPFSLLEAALSLGQSEDSADWLSPGLLPAAQRLRQELEAAASNPQEAARFDSPGVEGWLRLTGYEGDTPSKAHELRQAAFDTLVQAANGSESEKGRLRHIEAADSLMARISPDFMRLGRLREAQGRPEDAVDAYTRADASGEALRVWRQHGVWERALELAAGEARADLEWLEGLERLIERRPVGHGKRLYDGERERLKRLVRTVVGSRSVARKPGR